MLFQVTLQYKDINNYYSVIYVTVLRKKQESISKRHLSTENYW